jgi:hypothetical protein
MGQATNYSLLRKNTERERAQREVCLLRRREAMVFCLVSLDFSQVVLCFVCGFFFPGKDTISGMNV